MKQKPLDKKMLIEKHGNMPNEGAFEEAVTRMAQSKPRRVRKKKGE